MAKIRIKQNATGEIQATAPVETRAGLVVASAKAAPPGDDMAAHKKVYRQLVLDLFKKKASLQNGASEEETEN